MRCALSKLVANSTRMELAARAALCGFAVAVAMSFADRLEAQNAVEPRGAEEAISRDPTQEPPQETRRKGYLVQVPLPINASVQEQVEATIRRIVEQTGEITDARSRPVVVLEFDTSNGQTGRGSRLGSCLDLSRFLTSSDVSGVELVAFVPAPRGYYDATQPGSLPPKSELLGHSVLVALACNHLAMHRDAAIGQAGVDEPAIDESLRNAYRQVTAKRLVIPVEVALSMLDPGLSLYRVELKDGRAIFVDRAELQRLETEGAVVQSETLSEAGDLPLYTSETLAKFQLLRYRADSRRDITERFRLMPDALEGDPTLGAQWRAAQITLTGTIDERNVSWVLNALNQLSPSVNLLWVTIDSDQGDAEPCLRLASRLAEYDGDKIRTVAYIPKSARGNSVLIALACDHIIMSPDAVLGGKTRNEQGKSAVLPEPVQELAAKSDRDWSLLMALVDPTQPLTIWSHRKSGQLRVMSPAQLREFPQPDQADWEALRELTPAEGISGREAESLFIARYLVDDPAQLKALYQVAEAPLMLSPTWTDRWVHGLARFVTSPWVTAWLLFGAMFFLMTEMSTPGVGLPGFLGTLCLLLFFWGQSCNGNVHWLEVLLFVVGLGFVALEVFVLPGTGVLGLGGVGMIFVAIVLATQTFIIPRTPEEFARLPVSLSMVFAAIAGFFFALVLFRKYLTQMPVFKRLMLHSRDTDEALKDIDQREALVNWNYLLGQHGTTVTPLVPAGKAKFGTNVIDVVSDGQLIEPNRPVVVLRVSGNHVLVRPEDE